MHFFDIFLSLMNEKELRGHLFSSSKRVVHPQNLGVLFHSQIPKRDLIISARRSENRIFCWMPFNRGDGLLVPSKVGDWCWI